MSDRPTPIQLDPMLERALKAERKLAEAREALKQWAKVPFGGEEQRFLYARRLTIQALARIDEKGKETA